VKTLSVRPISHGCGDLSDYVTALAWSSKGDKFAASSAVGEVRVSNLSGETVDLKKPDGLAVSALGFSADGQFLAAGGQAGQLTVWSTASDFPVVLTQTHPGAWIDHLDWNPCRPHLAYGVGSQVQIRDVQQQSLLAELDFQDSSVLHLAWSPNATHLAASGHKGIKVWSSEDWSIDPQLIAVPGASLCTAWSPTGRYLGSGNLDRTLTVAEWGTPPPWLMQGFPGKVRQLSWASPVSASDSPLLAAACAEGITVWTRSKASKGSWQSRVLQHHRRRVNAIAFQPNSQLLASAGQDGQLGLWQNGRKLVQSVQVTPEGISALAWCINRQYLGQYLAVGGSDGTLAILKVSTGKRGFG